MFSCLYNLISLDKNILKFLLRISAYLFFVISIFGCTPSNLNNHSTSLTKNFSGSTLNIFRDLNSSMGYFSSYNTYIDNRYVGGLKYGSNLKVRVDPGHHVITVHVLNTYEAKLDIVTKANEIYYVKLDQGFVDTDPQIRGKMVGMSGMLNSSATYKTPKFFGKYIAFTLHIVEATK